MSSNNKKVFAFDRVNYLLLAVGMLEVYGLKGNYQDGISNEYYFDGLLVAMIMRYDPVGIILMSFGFAFLKVGSAGMELNAGIPGELYRIIQAVVIFFLAAQSGVKAIVAAKRKGGGCGHSPPVTP